MVDGVVNSVIGIGNRSQGSHGSNHGVKFWDDPAFLNNRYMKENQPGQTKLTQNQSLNLGLNNLSSYNSSQTMIGPKQMGQNQNMNMMSSSIGQNMTQNPIQNSNQSPMNNSNQNSMGQSIISQNSMMNTINQNSISQSSMSNGSNLSQLSLKSYPSRGYSRNNSEPSIPSRMNINAPSYIPSYAKDEDDLQEKYQRLKVELIMKDQIIKNLTDQMNVVSKARSDERNELSNANTMRVPQNHYELFEDLSHTLQEKTDELEDTKARLEAWILGSNVANTTTPHERLDPQELAHKMIHKLKMLQEENEALMKMMSLSNKVSLMVEAGMLRQKKNQNT